ncbi:hypothetical protein RQP46_008911 [Phenoliferia psychrophenolica]
MPADVPCDVCTAPGTLQCSRCRSIRFCGPEHQKLLWSSHKLICKPNAPLVFRGRRLEDSELLTFADSPEVQAVIREVVESGASTLEHSQSNFTPARLRQILAERTPSEREEATINILSTNAEIASAPHAAYAHAATALCKVSPFVRPPTSKMARLGRFGREFGLIDEKQINSGFISILEGRDANFRNAVELQTLVLCTLVEKDAPEDLIELALNRIGEVTNSWQGLHEWGRTLIRRIRKRKEGSSLS